MYTFIYRTIRRHGYADVTIPHRSTSKNPITLLNFPYIHSHFQSHSPRAPPWPSSPAFCELDLAVNQSASLLAPSFSPAGAIHQHPLKPLSPWQSKLLGARLRRAIDLHYRWWMYCRVTAVSVMSIYAPVAVLAVKTGAATCYADAPKPVLTTLLSGHHLQGLPVFHRQPLHQSGKNQRTE